MKHHTDTITSCLERTQFTLEATINRLKGWGKAHALLSISLHDVKRALANAQEQPELNLLDGLDKLDAVEAYLIALTYHPFGFNSWQHCFDTVEPAVTEIRFAQAKVRQAIAKRINYK